MLKTLLTVCALTSALAAGDLPLVAGRLVTGPNSRVALTNTGRQAVTAWSVTITTHPESGRTHRAVQMSDAYIAEVTRDLPRSSPHLDWIRPGESREIPLDPQPADAVAEVTAVVLEDGTGLGDPQTVKSILDHRIAERDELHKVVDIFNAVLPSSRGTAALEQLKSRLAAPAGEESTPHRSAREAVGEFLRRANAGKVEDADQALRQYAAFVQRQYEVAVKHTRATQ